MRSFRKVFLVLFCVLLALMSFSCSGDSLYDFVDVNHIINPTSGMPYSVFFDEQTGRYKNTSNHIISATIIGSSPTLSECYSTAVCVMGASKAVDFLQSRIDEGEITSAILFTADKQMMVLGTIAGYDTSRISEYKSYDMTLGNLDDTIDLPDIQIPEGSYSRYIEYAFARTIEFEFFIFGSDEAQKTEVRNRFLSLVEQIDSQINITREDSGISKLNNAAAGVAIEIGAHAYTLLDKAKQAFQETDGAFNVAVTPLSTLWNVDIEGVASYKAIGNQKNWTWPSTLPTLEQIASTKLLTDLNGLDIWEEEHKFFAKKNIDGLIIDLGGIAKGYAVEMCAEILKEEAVPSAQLNMSGHIYQHGSYFDADKKQVSSWKVGVTNPANKHDIFKNYVCAIQIAGNTSIITSGDYERFYSYGYSLQSTET